MWRLTGFAGFRVPAQRDKRDRSPHLAHKAPVMQAIANKTMGKCQKFC